MQIVEIVRQEVAPLQALPGPYRLIDIYSHGTLSLATATATDNLPQRRK
jgi:hypothetical protein